MFIARNFAVWRRLHVVAKDTHEVLGTWELRRPPGPLHEILSATEREEVHRRYGAQSFPRILAGDPQCRWLGAKAGDVLRVTRAASDVGGFEHHFRLVVPGTALEFRTIALGANGRS